MYHRWTGRTEATFHWKRRYSWGLFRAKLMQILIRSVQCCKITTWIQARMHSWMRRRKQDRWGSSMMTGWWWTCGTYSHCFEEQCLPLFAHPQLLYYSLHRSLCNKASLDPNCSYRYRSMVYLPTNLHPINALSIMAYFSSCFARRCSTCIIFAIISVSTYCQLLMWWSNSGTQDVLHNAWERSAKRYIYCSMYTLHIYCSRERLCALGAARSRLDSHRDGCSRAAWIKSHLLIQLPAFYS